MPAATTHVEFARDVLRIFPALKTPIKNRAMYYLGSQGPDLFLFSRGGGPGSLNGYGNLLHREKVFETVDFLYEHGKDDEDLDSYYRGFLCHYALDSLCHPLVYALADEEAAKTGGNAGAIHVRIEAEMDVWIMAQRGRRISDYDVWKWLAIDLEAGSKLAQVYHDLFKAVFNINIPAKKILSSARDVVRCTRLLRPTSEIKYMLVYGAESLAGSPHGISGMMLNGKKTDACLNLEHRKYVDRSKPDGYSRASFPQSYGKALSLAAKLMEEVPPQKDSFRINFLGDPCDNPVR